MKHICIINFHYEATPYDIIDFEICGFHKNTKVYISREQRNNYFLRIKGYFISKNSFVVEVTFNTRNRKLNFKNILEHYAFTPSIK